jgi:CRISPR/Cas system Type II protein with McrA/HNH and RuvC-like nuclease domain
MSVGKKLRFEVFKRDGFQCMYCGNKTPNVLLEIDHIEPKSKGGTDDINNLITACFDCNRGKSNIELKNLPNKLIDNIKIIKEKEAQYKQYRKIIELQNKRINAEIDEIEKIYQNYYIDYYLTERFKNSSIKQFINKLGFYETKEAMEKACTHYRLNENSSLKYFCGICWNKINER